MSEFDKEKFQALRERLYSGDDKVREEIARLVGELKSQSRDCARKLAHESMGRIEQFQMKDKQSDLLFAATRYESLLRQKV